MFADPDEFEEEVRPAALVRGMRPALTPEAQTAYVLLELGPELTVETLRQEAAQHNGLSLLGLDTPAPVLRIGSLVYVGQPDIPVGTTLLFKLAAPPGGQAASQQPPAPDAQRHHGTAGPAPVAAAPTKLHQIGDARRMLRFRRVNMKPRSRPFSAQRAAE
ncbi:General transcription factor 3C polypeptide 6 [Polyrhizophydium stewartii]|uniref:General transcription factor 3C polypeptide 6 n=1 Tax=Polyrhizophydium stewartii TaxID=2732419 RepID=A0ABR4NL61_9FUNG